MGTFDAKIRVAAALEIIGPITHDNLYCIKQLRNAFAHSEIPISFETDEVADVCRLLQFTPMIGTTGPAVDKYDTLESFDSLPMRRRFDSVCGRTSSNLITYAMRALQTFPWFSVPQSAEGDSYQVLVRPKPLP